MRPTFCFCASLSASSEVQQVGIANNGAQRGAELVRHGGQERAFRQVRRFGYQLGFPQLLLDQVLLRVVEEREHDAVVATPSSAR